jgi:ribosomal protein S27E
MSETQWCQRVRIFARDNGFLRVRCDQCRNEKLVAFSCKRRGFCPSCGARRMVESAALLFRQVAPPTAEELQELLHRVAHRVARYLERQGLLERDAENSYLVLESLRADASAMPDLYGHSITYRIALGPQRGKKGV